MNNILLFFLAILFLFSCDDPARITNNDLINTSWSLQMIGDEEFNNGLMTTLEFSEGNHVSGMAGCNRYFGSYQLNDKGLKIGEIGLTKMMCPEPLMKQEAKFIDAIKNATGARISDGRLYISNSDKKTLQMTRINP